MPRKPNYGFERRERDRLKAEKQAEREKAKAERRDANKAANASAADEGAADVEASQPAVTQDTAPSPASGQKR